MGILQDFQLFFSGTVRAQCVTRIDESVHMDFSGDQNRQSAEKRPEKYRGTFQAAAEKKEQPFRCADDEPRRRQKGHAVSEISVVPPDHGHRHRRVHGERNHQRLYDIQRQTSFISLSPADRRRLPSRCPHAAPSFSTGRPSGGYMLPSPD